MMLYWGCRTRARPLHDRTAASAGRRARRVSASCRCSPTRSRGSLDRPHRLRPSRGDGRFPRSFRPPGLCLRRAGDGRRGAAGFHRKLGLPPASSSPIFLTEAELRTSARYDRAGLYRRVPSEKDLWTTSDREPGQFEPDNKKSVVKPGMLSHGTMECYSLTESRRFYEDSFGLDACARASRHVRPLRHQFHIVAMQAGRSLKPAHLRPVIGASRWSREEVDRIHRRAASSRTNTRSATIFSTPALGHGVYSFYMEDLDHNWWEILFYDGFQHDDAFDFGDRFPMEPTRRRDLTDPRTRQGG